MKKTTEGKRWRRTVDEIAASTNLPPEKIAEVLKVVQTFEPVGVGARDLRECLLLHDIEGLSYNQIAYVAQIPVSMVLIRLCRARGMLIAACSAPDPTIR